MSHPAVLQIHSTAFQTHLTQSLLHPVPPRLHPAVLSHPHTQIPLPDIPLLRGPVCVRS